MSHLTDLTNIGSTLAERLEEIGIFNREDLEVMGAAKAYRQIQANYSDANLPLCYYLYSLEGALTNRDWRTLTDAEKRSLRNSVGR